MQRLSKSRNFGQYQIWILDIEGFCSEIIRKNRWRLWFEECEHYSVSLLLFTVDISLSPACLIFVPPSNGPSYLWSQTQLPAVDLDPASLLQEHLCIPPTNQAHRWRGKGSYIQLICCSNRNIFG